MEDIHRKFNYGDYQTVTSIFNSRHKSTGESVSVSYVGKVLRGERDVSPGTAAEEIDEIANRYLDLKNAMHRELEMEPT